MVFKALDIRQWQRVIPERWETNEVIPMTPLDFQVMMQGWGNQVAPGRHPELKRWTENLERPRWLEFAWQSPRGEQTAQKQNPGCLQRLPLDNSAESPSVRPGKEPSERFRGNGTLHSYRAKNCVYSHYPVEETS